MRHRRACCRGDASVGVPAEALRVMKASVYHLDTSDVPPIVIVHMHHCHRAVCSNTLASLMRQLSFVGPSCGVDGAAATIGVCGAVLLAGGRGTAEDRAGGGGLEYGGGGWGITC